MRLRLIAACLLIVGAAMVRAQTPAPKSPWDTIVQAGVTLTRGNSETLLANGGISTARRWTKSDFSSSIFLTYGTDRDRQTTDLLRAYGQYNQTLSERWYAGMRLEGLRDGVADVDYRFTLSPLVGWYAFKSAKFFLRAESGPSAAVIENIAGNHNEYLVWRVAERIEWRVSAAANLWQSFELLQPTDDANNFLVNGELGFNAAITDSIGIQPKVLATFDNEPPRGRQKYDLRWITSLTYRF
jgi:putative salt-induced outer membrane protein YdiY